MATGTSTLLLDEYLQTADPRLLGAMLASTQESHLRSLVERLVEDPRPFARQLLVDYVAQGLDRAGHRAPVKRLFKLAAARKDDVLMVALTHGVDQLTRRKIRVGERYNWNTRESSPVAVLKKVDAHIPYASHGEHRKLDAKTKPKGEPRRFSVLTRMHLCRRALRYWRALGRVDGPRYRRAVGALLTRYEDADLATAEQLLDAWNLLHLLYRGSKTVDRRPRGAVVRPGQVLKDLAFAPLHEKVWKDPAAAPDLLALMRLARCRPVRRFALAMLQAHHQQSLDALPLDTLLVLLDSEDEVISALAADLLQRRTGLENLPLDTWLRLLRVRNVAVLEPLCALVEKHVTPSRLSLVQCVELACSPAAPVAQLGFSWTQGRMVKTAADLGVVLALSGAAVAPVRTAASAWLVGLTETLDDATALHVRELLDARFPEPRAAAMATLEDGRFKDSAELWVALLESPFDDARAFLSRHLKARAAVLPTDGVLRLCATVLLNIHRGSAVKRAVLTEMVHHLTQDDTPVDALLTTLRVALRSIRPPERRHGLAALARAVWTRPHLRAFVSVSIPEVQLFPEEAA